MALRGTKTAGRIEGGIVLGVASLAVSIALAVIQFASAADSRDDVQDRRICRLEAIEGIGECKR